MKKVISDWWIVPLKKVKKSLLLNQNYKFKKFK